MEPCIVTDVKTALPTVACFGRSGFYFYTSIKIVNQVSAGQLSLHVSQMRNVHTVPCSHPLENLESTIKHWLHTAGVGYCPLVVFVHRHQSLWVCNFTDLYLPGRKLAETSCSVHYASVPAPVFHDFSSHRQDMENELNIYYAQKSIPS